MEKSGVQLTEVLPKAGLVYSEKGNLSEILCKPKILPIKSASLLRLEQMEVEAKEIVKRVATAQGHDQ